MLNYSNKQIFCTQVLLYVLKITSIPVCSWIVLLVCDTCICDDILGSRFSPLVIFLIFQVRYFSPVMIKDRKINEWLTAVEHEMRITLAKLLAQAVKDISEFRSGSIDQQNFMGWVDKYQAQLVVLASQIR